MPGVPCFRQTHEGAGKEGIDSPLGWILTLGMDGDNCLSHLLTHLIKTLCFALLSICLSTLRYQFALFRKMIHELTSVLIAQLLSYMRECQRLNLLI